VAVLVLPILQLPEIFPALVVMASKGQESRHAAAILLTNSPGRLPDNAGYVFQHQHFSDSGASSIRISYLVTFDSIVPGVESTVFLKWYREESLRRQIGWCRAHRRRGSLAINGGCGWKVLRAK
jgi:hypothetical protein